jgi:phenylalanyl-tRNA synthetase beta chain
MKLSRDWLSDSIDLSDLSDDELVKRFTAIGHAVESMERHGDDTVYDLEITTNRVDAMSHLGMARELAAALGRELKSGTPALPPAVTSAFTNVAIRIDAPQMCRRFSGLVIRGVEVKPSPAIIQRRLEAVGLRPINNIVDVTNYVMLALGHPMHAYDLDRLAGATIIVRAGLPGEKMKTLDGETRAVDAETVVIADAQHAVGLGGVMGGLESEITAATKNILLECAWFAPSVIRRTARRLGIKTDASYRFERGMDPNDTTISIDYAARMILDLAGGTRDSEIVDVVAAETAPKTIRLRARSLAAASGGVATIEFAHDLFRRLGFGATRNADDLEVTVPTYRVDIFEEMDLIEEVLRFFGYDRVPASLPRLTTGDARPYVVGDTEDEIRRILVGCGLTEAVNYSFIHPAHNPLFSDETPVAIANALNENIASMRLSMIPGLLETAVFNRSYGTRDGALFEVGRTYHREADGVREHHRIGIVMYGNAPAHWSDTAKRPIDFYDIKGVVEQIAAKLHVPLTYEAGGQAWLRSGKRAVARHGERVVASVGFIAPEVLQRFDLKGDVAAAEIDVMALLASRTDWKMTQVARYPGVPMIMAMTHARGLEYQRIIETIRGLNVPYLHEVGLRDRWTAEGDEVKTTLGMWYQAFDRSLTQDEIAQAHQQLAARIAELLPVKLLT